VLQPKRGYTEEQREQILAAYNERSSMRGIHRTFGVSRNTLSSWLKKDAQSPSLVETLLPAQAEDVLEADEMWSFVFEWWNKRWIWIVMYRRTRQIVAYVIGDRGETTCWRL
jgi:insertion element IS1 protein InsB